MRQKTKHLFRSQGFQDSPSVLPIFKKMMRKCKWSKKYELEYFTSQPDRFYVERLWEKYLKYAVEHVLKSHGIFDEAKIAMDIGGGPYGGALRFYTGKARKVLVDVLGEEFKTLGKLPWDVELCVADFKGIPFEDNSIKILFSWESIDHSLTWEDFQKSCAEHVRLLAPGGLLFLHVPIRKNPNEQHLPTPDRDEIMREFESLREIDIERFAPLVLEMQADVCTILTKE